VIRSRLTILGSGRYRAARSCPVAIIDYNIPEGFGERHIMSNPYLGEIRPWACNFAPRGWQACQGQLLPISQFTALFSLLGTFYGGNGTSNFQLPDLRSRVPLKYGQDPVGNVYDLGQISGVESVQLTTSTMPSHAHTFTGMGANGGKSAPADGCALATDSKASPFYATTASSLTSINPGTISTYPGGNLAHNNLQPYLAINWCIAMEGIYPARN
jgi:microcystin-dependent protein